VSVDWAAVAKAHWDAQPSPHAPGLTNGEVIPAVKLATKLKYGGHASLSEAALFYHEFKGLEMAPEDFQQAVDRLAPVSFTYHGRPPSMKEIKDLSAAQPNAIRAYYADLPDVHYPHVTAGQMVATLQAAEPHAQQYLQRSPVKYEAAQLAHSKEPPAAYYARIAATTSTTEGDTDGLQASAGGERDSRGNGAVR
jgi:hypothetical protein